MASGGFGRGGRGAALAQALQQPSRKPGTAETEAEKAQAKGPGATAAPVAVASTPQPSVPTGRGLGRGALLAGLLQKASPAAESPPVPQPAPQPSVSPALVQQPLQTSQSVPHAAPHALPSQPAARLPAGRGMAALRAALGASSTQPSAMSAPTVVPQTRPVGIQPQAAPPVARQPAPALQAAPSVAGQPSAATPSATPPTRGMRDLSIRDKPTISRPGSSGKPMQLSANYVRVKCKNKGVYQYHVDFEPEIDSKSMRFRLLNEFREMIGSTKAFDGFILYLPKELEQQVTVVTAKKPTDGTDVTLRIRKTKHLTPESCDQLYNNIFRRIMHILQMCQVGRYYYNPNTPTEIPQHKLEVWPGYITAIREHEGGLLLLADASHRVLRTDTVLDAMANISRRSPQNFQDQVTRMLVGCIVLTRYNNKTYRVDDIVWDKNPQHSFVSSSTGQNMTFMDYYRKNYNKEIKDPQQPLLLHRPKRRKLPGGEREGGAEVICLIPELCYMTGLTDEIRQDFRVMKDIATHTRVTPMQRQAALRKFVNSVTQNPECMKQLEGWGLELDTDTIPIEGRNLPMEKVIFRECSVAAGPEADWGRKATSTPVISAVALTNWLIAYIRRDQSKSQEFVQMMSRVCPAMGIEVQPPQSLELRDDRTDTLIRSLRDHITGKTQMVVIVCPTSRDDRYSAIKKLCCVECPVPSQVIIAKTIGQQQKLRSVTQKIALQINCKLGGELWAMSIPLEDLMVVGIDTFHQRGQQSVGGFVSSTNKMITRWYCRVCFQTAGQELIDGLKMCLTAALRTYHEARHSMPQKIVVFRDGVGDGQLGVVADYEVKQLQDCFKVFGESYQPKLAVVVVQKRINTRIFMKTPDRKLGNPYPGTVVDHTITRREWYDFFLVSQHVRQGTVSPTHYIVVHDSSGMTPDHMQRLTYKMTHLYYNWPGTVRVPAPCQYAHKLAYLVGQSIHKEPHIELSNRLFFL